MLRPLPVVVLVLCSIVVPALAERKLALVIGNSVYDNLPQKAQLPNAINDSGQIAATLTGLGFEVTPIRDQSLSDMQDAVFDFTRKISKGDIVFVFYAGHGVGIGGVNYLVMRDAPATREVSTQNDLETEERRLSSRSLKETFLVDTINEAGARVSIFVLDACRDNPFAADTVGSFRATGPDTVAIGRRQGLDVRQRTLPNGTVVIYSADRDQKALESLGRDDGIKLSPFTRVFSDELARPNRGLRDIVVATRDRVFEMASKVDHPQRPAYYETLIGGDVYLNGAPDANSGDLEREISELRRQIDTRNADNATLSAALEKLRGAEGKTDSQQELISRLQRQVDELRVNRMVTSRTVSSDTLAEVKARGRLACGVSQGLAGFSNPDETGNWTGLDADFCRAVAAAVLGDARKVLFVPLSAKERFLALQSGEIDMLSRNTTWTASRELSLGLRFTAITYRDGQGFMVRKNLGISSALQLSGASVCVQAGTVSEFTAADFFKQNGMTMTPVVLERWDEAVQAYFAGRCDVMTTDASGLYSIRATASDPAAHVVLPELASEENLGPYVRRGDDKWENIVRWAIYATIIAERLKIGSSNVDERIKGVNAPEMQRLLGTEGNMHEILGLESGWSYNIIRQVGNYAEIFERNLGAGTPLAMDRGMNRLLENGGAMGAPAFR
ncbi:MAG: caspase family protein [Notoacmeibacter sp.]|nr:caspase family protein [Notoacmeibacter sp.]